MKEHAKDRIESLEEQLRSTQNKSISQLVSDSSFYSYRHANRLFKSLKGDSINNFANKLRIQKSAELLKYSSENISNIAYQVGYESAASYSKAFKKVYQMSPLTFRKTYKIDSLMDSGEILKPEYSIDYFENIEIDQFKIVIDAEITEEEFYQNTTQFIEALNTDTEQWLLIWEEDPELCLVSESRYFIAHHNSKSTVNSTLSAKSVLDGKYAVFTSESFKDQPYSSWHELAILILDLDGKSLRDAPAIDWLALKNEMSHNYFPPIKIAIPIQ